MKYSDFITIQEITDFLTAQSADIKTTPGFDNNLKLFQKMAYTKIASYLNYDFISQDYTAETIRGNGTNRLMTINRPLTKLTKLVDANDSEITGCIAFNDSIYLPFKSTLGKLYLADYTAGWTSTEMPADIKVAGLMLVALYMNKSVGGSVSVGLSTVSSNNGSSSTVDPDAEKNILASISRYVNYAQI